MEIVPRGEILSFLEVKPFDTINLEGKNNYTRSLMLAGLSKQDSITLQDVGIGRGRVFGCGIFLPYKSIDAVDNFKDE